MNWTFFLGAAWMLALTTWLNNKEWTTIVTKALTDFYSGNLLKKLNRIILYFTDFILLLIGMYSTISQRSAFMLGATFMFVNDLLWNSHVLFSDLRGHIEQKIAKKALRLQQIIVLVSTLIYLFILK